MYYFLVSVALVLSFLLIIIVLMQSSKGGGLSGTLGGSGAGLGTMFGSRRTADFLSRVTWWLGAAIIVITLLVNILFLPGKLTTSQRESIIQSSRQNQVPTQPVLPQQSTQTPPAAGGN